MENGREVRPIRGDLHQALQKQLREYCEPVARLRHVGLQGHCPLQPYGRQCRKARRVDDERSDGLQHHLALPRTHPRLADS